jgi:hypothetical protein
MIARTRVRSSGCSNSQNSSSVRLVCNGSTSSKAQRLADHLSSPATWSTSQLRQAFRFGKEAFVAPDLLKSDRIRNFDHDGADKVAGGEDRCHPVARDSGLFWSLASDRHVQHRLTCREHASQGGSTVGASWGTRKRGSRPTISSRGMPIMSAIVSLACTTQRFESKINQTCGRRHDEGIQRMAVKVR